MSTPNEEKARLNRAMAKADKDVSSAFADFERPAFTGSADAAEKAAEALASFVARFKLDALAEEFFNEGAASTERLVAWQ